MDNRKGNCPVCRKGDLKYIGNCYECSVCFWGGNMITRKAKKKVGGKIL